MLTKIKEMYPNYKEEIFHGEDIKSYTVYSDINNEKVGSVDDILVDASGRFRYFVIDTGFWIFGKKVLLPLGRSRIDYHNKKLYAIGMTKEQAEALPKYEDTMTVDYDYEERVRAAYRTNKQPTSYNRDTYSYENDKDLYDTRDQDHGVIKLYEERLVAEKKRSKVGEVVVGKKVTSKTAQASVPVEKERVIIERTTPTDKNAVVPGEVNFREGEVARMQVYEETAEIHKQAFVREEVSVRKEVEKDTVTAKETVRREELELDVDGKPVIKNNR